MDGVRISAVIFDLDGTLLDTERATEGVLREFFEKYGKVLDPEKEVKRLGQMHKESAKAIVEDYELPMTAEEYSQSIMPIYQQRWSQAEALPGVNRLIQHLHKHGNPNWACFKLYKEAYRSKDFASTRLEGNVFSYYWWR